MSKVKAAEYVIGIEVLNALSPKRGMINAAAADLMNQTFSLHSMVTNDPTKSTDLKAVGDDNTFVKAKYVNKENSKSFLVPIRSLLNLDVAEIPEGEGEGFKAGETPVKRVHEWLTNAIEGAKTVKLPGEFKVVDVVDRVQEGTDNVMHPPYHYVAYNQRVKAIQEDPDYDPATGLDAIYNDFNFMTELYAGDLEPRFKDAEANKAITITINA